MKKLDEYDLVIWDLDGTLYFQKEFRKKMAEVLVKNLIFQPLKWKEALLIFYYRRLREGWDSGDTGADLEMRQYEKVGKKFGLSLEEAKEIIEYWMHRMPLKYLRQFRDEEAAILIKKLREQAISTVVYSDYPTKEKLKALEITVEKSFGAGDQEIGCLKPNPKGIEYIVSLYGVEKSQVLMIGDREEKDGLAAKAAGVDSLILMSKRKERQKQYQHKNLKIR